MNDRISGVRGFAGRCGSVRHFHLIGIGGIGMSGLSEILLDMGFEVSGSDLHRSALTDRLSTLGATIHEGHDAAHIGNSEVVVYTAAASSENPELVEARKRGLLTITRADLLAAFVRQGEGIAVAGTHGKTTTTAMTGLLLSEAGYDPTIIVGGVVPGLGSNVRIGDGIHIVAEADEYDRSFLGLSPDLAVITAVDTDHLECYGTQEEIDQAFITFANSIPCYQPVILCMDDPGVRRIRPYIRRHQVTYGFSDEARVRATDVTFEGFHSSCRLFVQGQDAGILKLQRPGRYNISNALAAIAVGHLLGIPLEKIRSTLEQFTGVKRRFEIKGCFKGVTVIDDYAHHPEEVRALLIGMKETPGGRMVAIFQPHLYSRTRYFADEFGRALALADVLFVTDVYPSREKPIPGITGEIIAQAARTHGSRDVSYVPDKATLADDVVKRLKPGDAVVTIGAGDITGVSDEILLRLHTDESVSWTAIRN